MSKEIKPLSFKTDCIKGISQKTIEIHHGKLYAGYVNKTNEISEKLGELRKSGKVTGNQIYSELRGLKLGETFARNGSYLHENYFAILGGDGVPTGEVKEAIEKKFGSMNDFLEYFSQCGMAARGWAILAWDMNEQRLMQYNCDAQNHGGVWGCIPIIAMDVYEHSYFIDTGSDRAAYIKAFFENLNWNKINQIYLQAREFSLNL
ncbi:MAG: Superoxide dismutase [Candidatus Yanofskybacteria bacterium GW2011_GWA1_44_21]|uniref:Superoxide dismutase n=2 Tax=Candidatus Yanofskyibacteriota TaxID=1752733 RepID=A0A1F8H1G2_9BACT|nr:MAG: Superoxide dismutase [Candidatus Yanofskybacteria bacterium GW2011_GWA2_44_10]KKT50586.1 MAG: Superoxide dismutase [Candidatus Yanofskybacteria bacterium GW2011_GWA1_44_21]KKT90101.1 MAG: Superoxide dismutase [Candidatus Yanofskybacteria bacterium GW2011_GWB1_45_11]OGN02766.1 MAG: hypothetical protein A2657_01320 [Candidatus Yanofskybacteria bacterium RIFCSPHIGHO2_01_FULL_44_110b]OGN14639.1 MAG: hypothetical protein A3C01_03065 [Candidatus Yanofskybacteria bacterium RIFCSPHIGHO2_02_FULL